ncbi:MAG: hypothetical protein PHU73_03570 [Patescibacteria group bacterium]|nr:hypothetical protein [Patescibacteria group bacterium]
MISKIFVIPARFAIAPARRAKAGINEPTAKSSNNLRKNFFAGTALSWIPDRFASGMTKELCKYKKKLSFQLETEFL